MKKSTLIVLAVIVLALVSAYAYLHSAHTRLADQYDQLLTEFAAAPPMCPSRPEQGSAAELYAQAFDQLPASAREFELWNAGQMKALEKQPASEAPLYRLWISLGESFVNEPVTKAASPEVLQCLGFDSPRHATDAVVRAFDLELCKQLRALEPSRRIANAATLRKSCASPYSPVNGWARGGKPIYGLLVLVSANRVQARMLDLAGEHEAAAGLRMQTVAMLLDLQRDAPLIESASVINYARTELRDLSKNVSLLDPSAIDSLRRQTDQHDAEWPQFHRTEQAEALWIAPTLVLPGVELHRSARNQGDYPMGAESLLLWFAAPAFMDIATDLTASTLKESLLAAIETRRAVMEKYTDEFFLPLVTTEITSVGPEAKWRINHAALRLLRLQLAGDDTNRLLAELKDPVTGQPFRASERQFSSAATDETFLKSIEERAGKYVAAELKVLTVERIR